MSDALQRWLHGGTVSELAIRGTTRRVFRRVSGTGPPLVLLHGFPASSLEWATLEPELVHRHTVIAFDFLGYGASEKPAGHRYSIFEQADLAESLIAALKIDRATLVAYDYGAIIAGELLARQQSRTVSIDRCIFMNAGLYPHLYRPRLTQRLMNLPAAGALLARAFNERLFIQAWSKVFSDEHPLDTDLAAMHYRALRDGDPDGDVHRRLLRYIPERARNRVRLERALVDTDVPLSFLWGMQDPVSGKAIADEIHRSRPGADLVEYSDAGHCPHIEIPRRVAADILLRTAVSHDSR